MAVYLADAKKAGVSYTEAVNKGIGKANGLKYTINPFKFIHAYQKGYKAKGVAKTSTSTKTPEKKETFHSAPSKKTENKKPAIPGGAEVIKAFEITASPNKILEGDSVIIKIIALNSKEARLRDFNETVELSYKDGSEVKKLFLRLKKGLTEKKITLNHSGRTNFRVKFKNTFKSTSVLVKKRPKVSAENNSGKNSSGKVENFDHFKISGEQAVREGESIVLTVRPLDKDGMLLPSEDFPKRVLMQFSTKNGIVSPNKLAKGNLAKWGRFKF